jgi:SAM-dependent methyltransferase
MHELLQSSIGALRQSRFRSRLVRFLALQRYELTPYRRVFGKLDLDEQFESGQVTVGGQRVSAEELATRFVDFLSQASPRLGLAELAESFWGAFPDAVGDAGPSEYVQATRSVGADYELCCLVPLLEGVLLARPPSRVLDFGCGANRLGPALQARLRQAGLPAPTVIGVDVKLPPNAHLDPARGVYLHDLRTQSLEAILSHPVDLIFLNYVLHHMTETEQPSALAAVAQALLPEGRVVILEASVDTNEDDASQFRATQQDQRLWPSQAWVAPYRSVSLDFYQADAREQRLLLCLEDVFGHVLLPGPGAASPSMPLPFSYIGRDELTRLARNAGLEPDPELSAVLGMPPTLKHGPPTSRLVLRPNLAA